MRSSKHEDEFISPPKSVLKWVVHQCTYPKMGSQSGFDHHRHIPTAISPPPLPPATAGGSIRTVRSIRRHCRPPQGVRRHRELPRPPHHPELRGLRSVRSVGPAKKKKKFCHRGERCREWDKWKDPPKKNLITGSFI